MAGTYEGGAVRVSVHDATSQLFVASAVVIARNAREQASQFHHFPGEIRKEVDRAIGDIKARGAVRSIGALVLTADAGPLAYAYATEHGSEDGNTVEMANICVDPRARGYGLSAVATLAVLRNFDATARLQDSLSAATILLQGDWEAPSPEYGVYGKSRVTEAVAGAAAHVMLPPAPTVNDLQLAIHQAFPSLPEILA